MNALTNEFRPTYRELTEAEKAFLVEIKTTANDLLYLIEEKTKTNGFKIDPRMRALARTNLEQAVMWAVKAVTG